MFYLQIHSTMLIKHSMIIGKNGILGIEMESTGLYLNAINAGKKR